MQMDWKTGKQVITLPIFRSSVNYLDGGAGCIAYPLDTRPDLATHLLFYILTRRDTGHPFEYPGKVVGIIEADL